MDDHGESSQENAKEAAKHEYAGCNPFEHMIPSLAD